MSGWPVKSKMCLRRLWCFFKNFLLFLVPYSVYMIFIRRLDLTLEEVDWALTLSAAVHWWGRKISVHKSILGRWRTDLQSRGGKTKWWFLVWMIIGVSLAPVWHPFWYLSRMCIIAGSFLLFYALRLWRRQGYKEYNIGSCIKAEGEC